MYRNLLTLLIYVSICSALPKKLWHSADELHIPGLYSYGEEKIQDLIDTRKARHIATEELYKPVLYSEGEENTQDSINTRQTREISTENKPVLYSEGQDLSDTRQSRQIETTVAEFEAETTEAITETPEAKVTLPETPEDVRTTPSELAGRSVVPRFYSKLSYFQKNEDERLLVNLLESKSSRRKFRSKCRCEKISNCPKLQMSVGRCPTDYFLCCF